MRFFYRAISLLLGQRAIRAEEPQHAKPLGAVVDGEVWINGHKLRGKVSPYVGETYVSLSMWDTIPSGPYTRIHFSPETVASTLERVNSPDWHEALTGESIGSIDKCIGYAAMDVGPHTRQILECDFGVKRQAGATRFSFEGTTDYLDPKSVESYLNVDIQSQGRYTFKILVVLDDADIPEVFKDEEAVHAMERYVKRFGAVKDG